MHRGFADEKLIFILQYIVYIFFLVEHLFTVPLHNKVRCTNYFAVLNAQEIKV